MKAKTMIAVLTLLTLPAIGRATPKFTLTDLTPDGVAGGCNRDLVADNGTIVWVRTFGTCTANPYGRPEADVWYIRPWMSAPANLTAGMPNADFRPHVSQDVVAFERRPDSQAVQRDVWIGFLPTAPGQIVPLPINLSDLLGRGAMCDAGGAYCDPTVDPEHCKWFDDRDPFVGRKPNGGAFVVWHRALVGSCVDGNPHIGNHLWLYDVETGLFTNLSHQVPSYRDDADDCHDPDRLDDDGVSPWNPGGGLMVRDGRVAWTRTNWPNDAYCGDVFVCEPYGGYCDMVLRTMPWTQFHDFQFAGSRLWFDEGHWPDSSGGDVWTWDVATPEIPPMDITEGFGPQNDFGVKASGVLATFTRRFGSQVANDRVEYKLLSNLLGPVLDAPHAAGQPYRYYQDQEIADGRFLSYRMQDLWGNTDILVFDVLGLYPRATWLAASDPTVLARDNRDVLADGTGRLCFVSYFPNSVSHIFCGEPCADIDADGLCDADDNCPTTHNPDQIDANLFQTDFDGVSLPSGMTALDGDPSLSVSVSSGRMRISGQSTGTGRLEGAKVSSRWFHWDTPASVESRVAVGGAFFQRGNGSVIVGFMDQGGNYTGLAVSKNGRWAWIEGRPYFGTFTVQDIDGLVGTESSEPGTRVSVRYDPSRPTFRFDAFIDDRHLGRFDSSIGPHFNAFAGFRDSVSHTDAIVSSFDFLNVGDWIGDVCITAR